MQSKRAAVESIEVGTMIQTGANGRWNAPARVTRVAYRGVSDPKYRGVKVAYVGVSIDTGNGGSLSFSIDEETLGVFHRISPHYECPQCGNDCAGECDYEGYC